jgi:hypothetical protein
MAKAVSEFNVVYNNFKLPQTISNNHKLRNPETKKLRNPETAKRET